MFVKKRISIFGFIFSISSLLFLCYINSFNYSSSKQLITFNSSNRVVRTFSLLNRWLNHESINKEIIESVYNDRNIARENIWDAVVKQLRNDWDGHRNKIYDTLGVKEYLNFLERQLTDDNSSIPNRIKALWEMRYIYFDIAEGGILGILEQTDKDDIQNRILNHVIEKTGKMQSDFELWYNTKEVLTEMLQDSSHRTLEHGKAEGQDMQIQSPREEVWGPAFVASLKAIAQSDKVINADKIQCIVESIIPVRIKYNPNMYQQMIKLIQDNDSIWNELGLSDLNTNERKNLRIILAKKVVGEMLAVLKNDKQADKTNYERFRDDLINEFKTTTDEEMADAISEALKCTRCEIMAESLLEKFKNLTNQDELNSIESRKVSLIIDVLALVDYGNNPELIKEIQEVFEEMFREDNFQEEIKLAIETLIDAGAITQSDIVSKASVSQTSLSADEIGKFGNNIKTRIQGNKLIIIINGNEAVYEKLGFLEGMHSNPIEEYKLVESGIQADGFGRDLPSRILIKSGNNIDILNEYIASRFYAKIGVPIPRMTLVGENDNLRIAIEFLDNYEEGGRFLPKQYHDLDDIQKGIFVSALLNDVDAAPWNMLFNSRENPSFYRIDAGGFITRPTGRLVEFNENIGVRDFNRVTQTARLGQNLPVNAAYQKVKENFDLLSNMIQEFEDKIKEEDIKNIINGVFDEIKQLFGDDRILDTEIDKHWFPILVTETPYWHRKPAWDHVAAMETSITILEGLEGLKEYYMQALLSRRNTLIGLFNRKELAQLMKGFDYIITGISQEKQEIVLYSIDYVLPSNLHKKGTVFSWRDIDNQDKAVMINQTIDDFKSDIRKELNLTDNSIITINSISLIDDNIILFSINGKYEILYDINNGIFEQRRAKSQSDNFLNIANTGVFKEIKPA